MRVAVITPYYRETTEILRQCHQSVVGQSFACRHFVVADGHPSEEVASWDLEHVTLPRAHGDNGNTPRCVGSLTAINQGFDAIAYLDADNWFYPNHIAAMCRLHLDRGAVIGVARRSFHRLDGSFMYSEDPAPGNVEFADTSCTFLTRSAFKLVPYWAMMPKNFGPICDRIIWSAIVARDLPRIQFAEPTVAFRTQYASHYKVMNETPPPGAKDWPEVFGAPEEWHKDTPKEDIEAWKRYFRTGRW